MINLIILTCNILQAKTHQCDIIQYLSNLFQSFIIFSLKNTQFQQATYQSMLKKFQQKREEEQNKAKTQSNSLTSEQRMKKDILRYEEDKIANVEITFPNEGTVTEIHISILPTQTSIYANSKITFSYKAPEDYPFSQPQVKCLNIILHPNIDKKGNVCLSILRQGWKANYELYQVVVGLLHLLQNIDSKDIQKPLDAQAAQLMNKDFQQFKKVVQTTIKGGKYLDRQYDNVFYVPKKKK